MATAKKSKINWYSIPNGSYYTAKILSPTGKATWSIRGRIKTDYFSKSISYSELDFTNATKGHFLDPNANYFGARRSISIDKDNLSRIVEFNIITDQVIKDLIDSETIVEFRNYRAWYNKNTDTVSFGCGRVAIPRQEVLNLIESKEACERLTNLQKLVVDQSRNYLDISTMRGYTLAKLKTLLTVLPKKLRK